MPIPENLLEVSERLESSIRRIESAVQGSAAHEIHYRNHFNRKFSVLLSFLLDLRVVLRRVHEQRLIRESHDPKSDEYWNHAKNVVDLKSMYVFAKIFSDQYVELLDYILQFERRGIAVKSKRGHYTISTLYFSIKGYEGSDQIVLSFKQELLKKLNALYVFVVEYRDTHIMHPGLDTWSDTWTLSNPDGSTRFLTKRPSSTPAELAFVVENFIQDTALFVSNNIELILKNWEKPEKDDYPLRPWEAGRSSV